MLIVYDLTSGAVLDNTGTSSAWPEGPPDDRALLNLPDVDPATVGLLRLHDRDQADQVALALTRQVRVEGERLVDAGPFPEPEPVELAPSVDERLAAVETELRGMKERAAAASVTGGAAAVRDAITGPKTDR